MLNTTNHSAILPTAEAVRNFNKEANLYISHLDNLELLSQAVSVLEYDTPDQIPREAAIIQDRFTEDYSFDVGTNISKAWVLLVISIRDVLLRTDIYKDRRLNYYFKGLAGEDIVLEAYDPPERNFPI